jgi:MFS family permease
MPFRKGIKLAVGNLQNWWCGLYTSFLNMPLMVIGGLWGSIFLQQMHGMNIAQAATISSMLFVGTIFGSPAFGMLSDVLRNRKIPMFVGAVFSLLSMLWLIFSPAFSFWGAMALFWLIGFITSAQILSYPAITESNPRAITGTALGLASALIMAGAGVSQTIFGFLIDLRWDHVTESGIAVYSASNYHLAMMMFSVVLVLGLVLSLVIRETRCKNVTES